MKRAAGFTLVEVMVALTVLSLIMLATVGSLRTFGNTQASVERVTDRIDEIRTVSSFLRDTMESAVTRDGPGDQLSLGGGATVEPWFNAGDNFVEWKSIVIFGEAFGGPYIVRVVAEQGQLLLRWQQEPRIGTPTDWHQTPSRVLVDELEEFAVTMRMDYDAPWEAGRKLNDPPALVRLTMKSSGRYWPDLVLKVLR